jgi:hypothetical protein
VERIVSDGKTPVEMPPFPSGRNRSRSGKKEASDGIKKQGKEGILLSCDEKDRRTKKWLRK